MGDQKKKWRLGEILVQKGWITWQQLEEALEIQNKANENDAVLLESAPNKKSAAPALNLGEILVKNGWISWQQLEDALSIQQRTWRMLGDLLVERGYISRKDLYRGLAQQYNKPFVDFEKINVPSDVLALIPKHLAYELQTIPLVKKSHVLLIAISDPRNIKPELEVKQVVKGFEICSAIAAPEEIKAAIEKYYGKPA